MYKWIKLNNFLKEFFIKYNKISQSSQSEYKWNNKFQNIFFFWIRSHGYTLCYMYKHNLHFVKNFIMKKNYEVNRFLLWYSNL